MSQQINLLIEKLRRPAISAERALVALSLLLAASLTYAMIERNKTSKVQDAVKSGETRLVGERASVKAMEDRLANRPKPDELNKEVAYLTDLATNKQKVLEELRSGGAGSEAGYYDHLVALSKVSENGVWIMGVNITDAGSRMVIEGRALTPDAVVRYAQRLNEQFAPFGVKFSTMEVTSLAISNDKTVMPVVKFILR
jgi:hypothetical protein